MNSLKVKYFNDPFSLNDNEIKVLLNYLFHYEQEFNDLEKTSYFQDIKYDVIKPYTIFFLKDYLHALLDLDLDPF